MSDIKGHREGDCMTEVINVGKRMREEAYYKAGHNKQKIEFRVSKEAIREMVSWVDAIVEKQVASICKNLAENGRGRPGRKTIFAEDVIRIHSFKLDIPERE